MMDRKYYIDNLRWLTVLLLFPFHVFIIYNTFGDGNYIKGQENIILTNIIVSFWPWFMPLLFVLAGISSKYSLDNRNIKGYIKERIKRLFIPLTFGIIFIIPCMAFFADCFHNNYTGNYFQHYIIFFTRITDLTGYDGGFSPGHLWFILYLYIISLIALPFIMLYKKMKFKIENMNILLLSLFFILPFLGQPVLNIGGKSIGEYFAYYIIGYFLLSNDHIIERLNKHYKILLFISIIGMVIILIEFNLNISLDNVLDDLIGKLYAFISILALLGISYKYLNISNKVTKYLNQSSFCVYVFHLLWITVIAYISEKYINNIIIQVITILLFSIVLTFATYEICKRNKVTRFMFSIK
jgi:peptidoglycan/LPS O-acetylase OafA/YrhL